MADKISLKEAKEQFSTLLKSVNNTDKKHFITFIFQEISLGDGCEDFVELGTFEYCSSFYFV